MLLFPEGLGCGTKMILTPPNLRQPSRGHSSKMLCATQDKTRGFKQRLFPLNFPLEPNCSRSDRAPETNWGPLQNKNGFKFSLSTSPSLPLLSEVGPGARVSAKLPVSPLEVPSHFTNFGYAHRKGSLGKRARETKALSNQIWGSLSAEKGFS